MPSAGEVLVTFRAEVQQMAAGVQAVRQDISSLTATANNMASNMEQASGRVTGSLDRMEKQSNSVVSSLKRVFEFAAGQAVFASFDRAATSVKNLVTESTLAAARVGEMNVVLGALAKTSGTSEGMLHKQVDGIRALHIETSVAQNAVAQFTRYQLDASKATQIARVAQDAGVLANVSTSESLNRIIYGLTTRNTQVLRTAGLTIDMNKAEKDMASQLGVTVQSLSETQRQQAGMNAVLQEGTRISGVYTAAMQSPGKQLRSLQTDIGNLKNVFGEAFQGVFGVGVLNAREKVKEFMTNLELGGKWHEQWMAFGDALKNIGTAFVQMEGPIQQFLEIVTSIGIDTLTVGLNATAEALSVLAGFLKDNTFLVTGLAYAFVAWKAAGLISWIGGLTEKLAGLHNVLGAIGSSGGIEGALSGGGVGGGSGGGALAGAANAAREAFQLRRTGAGIGQQMTLPGMGAAAGESSKLANALNGVKAAGAGAAAGMGELLAAIGPEVVVTAAAAAGFAYLSHAQQESAKFAKEAADAQQLMLTVLQQTHGSTGKTYLDGLRDSIIKNMPEMSTGLKTLGSDWETLLAKLAKSPKSATGLSEMIRTFNVQGGKSSAGSGLWGWKRWDPTWGSSLTNDPSASRKSVVSLADTGRDAMGNKLHLDQAQKQILDFYATVAKSDISNTAFKNFLGRADEVARGAGGMGEKIKALRASFDLAKTGVEGLTKAHQTAAEAAQAQADAVDALGKALNGAMDPQLSLIQAAAGWSTALDPLLQSVMKFGTTLDGNTQSAFQNQTAIGGIAKQALGYVEAQMKADGSTKNAAATMGVLRQQIIDQAAAMGYNKDQVAGLLDRLGLVTSNVDKLSKTLRDSKGNKIKIETGEADAAIAEVQKRADDLAATLSRSNTVRTKLAQDGIDKSKFGKISGAVDEFARVSAMPGVSKEILLHAKLDAIQALKEAKFTKHQIEVILRDLKMDIDPSHAHKGVQAFINEVAAKKAKIALEMDPTPALNAFNAMSGHGKKITLDMEINKDPALKAIAAAGNYAKAKKAVMLLDADTREALYKGFAAGKTIDQINPFLAVSANADPAVANAVAAARYISQLRAVITVVTNRITIDQHIIDTVDSSRGVDSTGSHITGGRGYGRVAGARQDLANIAAWTSAAAGSYTNTNTSSNLGGGAAFGGGQGSNLGSTPDFGKKGGGGGPQGPSPAQIAADNAAAFLAAVKATRDATEAARLAGEAFAQAQTSAGRAARDIATNMRMLKKEIHDALHPEMAQKTFTNAVKDAANARAVLASGNFAGAKGQAIAKVDPQYRAALDALADARMTREQQYQAFRHEQDEAQFQLNVQYSNILNDQSMSAYQKQQATIKAQNEYNMAMQTALSHEFASQAQFHTADAQAQMAAANALAAIAKANIEKIKAYKEQVRDLVGLIGELGAKQALSWHLNAEQLTRVIGLAKEFSDGIHTATASWMAMSQVEVKTDSQGNKSVQGSDILKHYQDKVRDMNEWVSRLTVLRSRGLDPSLIRELALAGPDSLPYVSALVNMDAAGIASINSAQQKVRDLADSVTGSLSKEGSGKDKWPIYLADVFTNVSDRNNAQLIAAITGQTDALASTVKNIITAMTPVKKTATTIGSDGKPSGGTSFGGPIRVNVVVQGSVTTERQLVSTIRSAILKVQNQNSTSGIA